MNIVDRVAAVALCVNAGDLMLFLLFVDHSALWYSTYTVLMTLLNLYAARRLWKLGVN